MEGSREASKGIVVGTNKSVTGNVIRYTVAYVILYIPYHDDRPEGGVEKGE